MKTSRVRVLLGLALVASLAFELPGGTIAGTDVAGDANGINGQGFVTGGGIGDQQTAPASYDQVDLLEGRYETLYTTVPVGGDGYTIVPTGVAVHMKLNGVPGSQGPTNIYRATVSVNDCTGFLQGYLSGPATTPVDAANGTVQWRQTAASCPEGAKTINYPTKVVVDAATKTLTLNFLYADMTAASRGAMAPSKWISGGTFETRLQLGGTLTAPMLDSMAVYDWQIGSDLPASKPCTVGC